MHATSLQSRQNATAEKGNYWFSYGPQLCKSVMLSMSSIGLGWLMNKLWTGSYSQKTSFSFDEHALVPYRSQENNFSSLCAPSFTGSYAQIYSIVPSSFKKLEPFNINYPTQQQKGLMDPSKVYLNKLENKEELISYNSPSTNLCFLSTIYLLGCVMKSTDPHTFTPSLMALLGLSLANFAQAGPVVDFFSSPVGQLGLNILPSFLGSSIGDAIFPTESVNEVLESNWNQARITLDYANQIIEGNLEKFGDIQHQFLVNFGEQGQLLIKLVGNEVRMSSENIKKGAQATLKVAGYEARATLGVAGKETRATVEYVAEKVRLIIQDGNKVIQGTLQQTEDLANRVIINFGKEGQLMIEKVGDTVNVTADKVLKKFFKGTQATIEIAGTRIEMIINRAEQAANLVVKSWIKDTQELVNGTADTVKKTFKHMLLELVIASGEGVKRTFRGIKTSIFGEHEFERIREELEIVFRKGTIDNENITNILEKSLGFVRTQTQKALSSSEKANLYVELIKFVNRPSINVDDRKWLLFSILGSAFQDKIVNRPEENCFETVVLDGFPDEEIREAFKTKNFKKLGDDLFEYCKKAQSRFGLKLEKSCPSLKYPNQIGLDDDIPVGSIIAYASDLIPKGYVKCDGQWYSKAEYEDLYKILKDHCQEKDNMFQVPNLKGLFVRGAFDDAGLGKFSPDSTRMPRKPFEIRLSGAHIHDVLANGEHKHILDVSGQHKHKILPGGNHTHEMSPSGGHNHKAEFAGSHLHVIENAGNHKHFLEAAGEHNHNADNYKYLLKLNECGTVRTAGDCDQNEPNIYSAREIQPTGKHTHVVQESGVHSHPMKEAGKHNHDISFENSHTHNIHFSTHQHDLDEGGSHSHTIQSTGSHTHKINKSEEHTHEIAGGDDETSPQNVQFNYLIKAESTQVVKHMKDLEDRLEELTMQLQQIKDNSIQHHHVISTMIIGALVAIGFRLRGCAC